MVLPLPLKSLLVMEEMLKALKLVLMELVLMELLLPFLLLNSVTFNQGEVDFISSF